MEQIKYSSTQRRLRSNLHMRDLTANVKISHKSFIQPIFVEEALESPRAIQGLKGINVDTLETVIETIALDIQQGVHKFLLFPVPNKKLENSFDFSFAAEVIQKIKKTYSDNIWIAADLCLCSYTNSGHCGILNHDHSQLNNDQSVQELVKYAIVLAKAGADCIAPSDMMDGRIAAIRKSLDQFGFDQISIMSYAAKFSSQFYGPFRDACHSSPNSTKLKDRKTYQISPFNQKDAIASALRDEQEGADILMVKPACLYQDIISTLHSISNKPIAAYHVSGEYASIELLAEQGLVNRAAAHIEVWAALQRSGADIIISYAARHAYRWLVLEEQE